MNRIKKELKKRGIIGESAEPCYSVEYCEKLAFVTKEFIVTVYECDVLDPEFRIYSAKTFEQIASQNVRPDKLFPNNRWDSYGVI